MKWQEYQKSQAWAKLIIIITVPKATVGTTTDITHITHVCAYKLNKWVGDVPRSQEEDNQ